MRSQVKKKIPSKCKNKSKEMQTDDLYLFYKACNEALL